MVEQLREFKVEFYMDSNKRTSRKVFDLDDYDDLDTLINDIEELLTCIQNEGILTCL